MAVDLSKVDPIVLAAALVSLAMITPVEQRSVKNLATDAAELMQKLDDQNLLAERDQS